MSGYAITRERPTASPTLPFPLTFVCRHPEVWPELISEDRWLDPQEIHGRLIRSEDCWVTLTYLMLKKDHPGVQFSDRLATEGISVVNAKDVGFRAVSADHFVVGCRSDGAHPCHCDFAVVQNRANLTRRSTAYIPHWPQPGLIPRSRSRGRLIQTIVYKGEVRHNLHQSFQSDEFRADLAKLGVRLAINSLNNNGDLAWNDYGGADLVLAARDLTEADARVKPASKLVNAWTAGVPALLGPEPAFLELRRSDLDFITVTSPDDVLAAVRQLQEDPERYQRIIENGLERARDYSFEAIASRWVEVLAGPVAQQYRTWCRRPRLIRLFNYAARFPFYRLAKRQALHDIHHGRRILSASRV